MSRDLFPLGRPGGALVGRAVLPRFAIIDIVCCCFFMRLLAFDEDADLRDLTLLALEPVLSLRPTGVAERGRLLRLRLAGLLRRLPALLGRFLTPPFFFPRLFPSFFFGGRRFRSGVPPCDLTSFRYIAAEVDESSSSSSEDNNLAFCFDEDWAVFLNNFFPLDYKRRDRLARCTHTC